MADGTVKRLPTADEAVDKMTRNLDAMGDEWVKKTLTPTKDPIEEALRKEGKHKARTIEALNEGRYGKGLRRVDKAQMRAAIAATPPTAVADGVKRRIEKVRSRMRAYFGELGTHVSAMDALPANTDAEAEAKVLANLRGMKAIGKKLRG